MSEEANLPAPVDAAKHVPAAFEGKLEPNYYCRGWNTKRAKYCRSRAGAGTDHPGVGRCRQHDGGASAKITHGLDRRYPKLRSERLQTLVDRLAQDPKPFDVRQDLELARALFFDYVDRYDQFAPALIAWHDTWEGKYTPLNETEARALVRVLDEYEETLAQLGDDATAQQHADLQSARAAVAFLSVDQNPKPRQILDVSDAVKHAENISKMIHRAEQIRQHGSISIERVRLFMLAIDRVLEVELSDVEQRQRIRKGISAIRV